MDLLMRRRNVVRGKVSALLVAVAVLSGAASAGAAEVDEYELKAAFLYNFAKFVQWPDAASAPDASPIRVCVLGGPALADIVAGVMEGKDVEGRGLAVERLDSVEGGRGCHILFVARDAEVPAPAVAQALGGSRTLTVGERPGFAREGGIVNFITEGNKIRFEINRAAARKADLRISSKLLRLAKLVDG